MQPLRILVLAAPTLLVCALAATHSGRANALINGRPTRADASGFVHLHGAYTTCSGTLIAPDTILSSKGCFTGAEIIHPDLAGWFMGAADSDQNPAREIHVHPTLDAALVRLTHPLVSTMFDLYRSDPRQVIGSRMTCNGYGTLGGPQMVYGGQLSSGEFNVPSVGPTTLNVLSNVLFAGYDQGGGCVVTEDGRQVLAAVMSVANFNPTSVTASLRRFVASFATWHELESGDSNQCIRAPRSAALNAVTPLEIAACDGNPGEGWEVKTVDNGNVEVRAKASNLCLTTNGDTIVQARCGADITEAHPGRLPTTRRLDQLWAVSPATEGFVELMSVGRAGRCIDATPATKTSAAVLTLATCSPASRSQHLRINVTLLDDKDHRLEGAPGCASAKEARSGGHVGTDACSGKDNQVWRLERAERPYFLMHVREGRYGRCISSGGSTLQEAGCVGTTDAQKWRLEYQPEGTYALRAKQTGTCALATGGPLDLHACDSAQPKQHWTLE